MRVKLENFGRFGVVHDSQNVDLPIGVWSDSKNVRFTGRQIEKMLEPIVEIPFDSGALGEPQWMQGWSDGQSTYVVVATSTRLYYYSASAEGEVGSWVDASWDSGAYTPGIWDSFAWGDTVIFNNQSDPPQIFNRPALKFETLPNWGLISTGSDISENAAPSVDTNARCRVLRPYKNYLVAGGITESGVFKPNVVWWSDNTSLATYEESATGGPPSWDYESPATASGQASVGIGDGAITCAENLNENLIVYTERSATALQFVGGRFIMATRRLFQKGAAAQRCVVEFNNQHFVVSRDQIYVHDGSRVRLIANDRVEEEFFTRIGKGGRFGGEEVNWETVQVVKNPDRKEIYVLFGEKDAGDPDLVPEPYLTALVAVTETGTNGAVYILNETSETAKPADQTTFGNDITRNFGMGPGNLGFAPFTSENYLSTLTTGGNGYRDESNISLSGVRQGVFGCCIRNNNSQQYRIIDLSWGDNGLLAMERKGTAWVVKVDYDGPGIVDLEFPADTNGDHVIYIAFQIGGTTIDIELYDNFISLGTQTVNQQWADGTSAFRIGGTQAGNVGANEMSHVFWSDRLFDAADILRLSNAFNDVPTVPV